MLFVSCQLAMGQAAKAPGKSASKKPVVSSPQGQQSNSGNKEKQLKDVTILGEHLATEQQAVNFIKKYSPNAKLNCSVEEIVRLYFKEAAAEGIRADLALSQALLETGFFRYGGDVKPYQNNFCGLGSVGGGAKGATFATPELGVRAHIQHLLAYSSKEAPRGKVVDPRYNMVKSRPDIFGVCTTWKTLDGRWAAAGRPYGERILDIHYRMLQTEPKRSVEEVKEVEKPQPEKKEEAVKADSNRRMQERVKVILQDAKGKKT